MYHGAHTKFQSHIGQCLTDDRATALAYARGGELAIVGLGLAGLAVVEVTDYDRDADYAPGDDGDARGADVLVYADEDPKGQAHRTWRLMSQAAVDAVTVRAVLSVDWVQALTDGGVSEDDWAATDEQWEAAGADVDDFEDHDGDFAEYQE